MRKKLQKSKTHSRKLDHIKIVREKDIEPLPSSFDKYAFPYVALPELDLADIDTTIEFFRRTLSFPFIISSITGGPEKGHKINVNLAKAAEHAKVALGLGSMRIMIEKPELTKSFKVRKYCPSIPLFANLGIVQLNYGFGEDEVNKLVDTIEADGIFLHVNHLHEAVQPEGDTNFQGLIKKLEKLIPKVHVPIIIKEVGHGIDKKTAKKLHNIGIKWIDVSGTGGSSWALIENYRSSDNVGEVFKAVGIPTDKALIDAKSIKGLNLIAGGGIRNGLHIAKSIALGAKLATAAKPLLKPALEKDEKACIEILERLKKELGIAMFCAGVQSLPELSKIKLAADHDEHLAIGQ